MYGRRVVEISDRAVKEGFNLTERFKIHLSWSGKASLPENCIGFAHILVGLSLQRPDLVPTEYPLEGSKIPALFVLSLVLTGSLDTPSSLRTALFLGTDNGPDILSNLVKSELLRVFLKA